MSLAEKITATLAVTNGMPDRPLGEAIFGTRHRVHQINQECRYMEQLGLLQRKLRPDGLIGNFLTRQKPTITLV